MTNGQERAGRGRVREAATAGGRHPDGRHPDGRWQDGRRQDGRRPVGRAVAALATAAAVAACTPNRGAYLTARPGGSAGAVLRPAGGQGLVEPGAAGIRQGSRKRRAVAWATAQLGRTGWDGWCERFVEIAYGAYGPQARYATALAHYDAERRAGRIHSGTPPFGGLAFFRNPFDQGNGHVMISRGDGTYLSSGPTVRVVPAAYGSRPLGWSYAPASWPGP